MQDPFVRRFRPGRAVDGDTLDGTLDLGWSTYRDARLRVLGVNSPELHAPEPADRAAAAAARDFTADWLVSHSRHADSPAEWPLVIRSEKLDVFGRALADVLCSQDHSLGADLLATGHAVPFHA